MDKLSISENLFLQLSELFDVSSNKSKLLSPQEIKESTFFIMVEVLQIITDSISTSDDESNELFTQYYSVCLRGVNPFKESVLKKAGIDSKIWKRLLKELSGDF